MTPLDKKIYKFKEGSAYMHTGPDQAHVMLEDLQEAVRELKKNLKLEEGRQTHCNDEVIIHYIDKIFGEGIVGSEWK